jgi:hypothetical protein
MTIEMGKELILGVMVNGLESKYVGLYKEFKTWLISHSRVGLEIHMKEGKMNNLMWPRNLYVRQWKKRSW